MAGAGCSRIDAHPGTSVGTERRAWRDERHDRRGGATACPHVACQAADVVFAERRVADGLGARDIIGAVMLRALDRV